MPRDETIIATALGAVNANPELFLKAACQARTRLDELFYRSGALLAAAYRRHRAALHEFQTLEGVLFCESDMGALPHDQLTDLAGLQGLALTSGRESPIHYIQVNFHICNNLWTTAKTLLVPL